MFIHLFLLFSKLTNSSTCQHCRGVYNVEENEKREEIMKKVRNLVIALLLVCAITVPTLAANANISANSEEEGKIVIQNIISGFGDEWNDVKPEDVEITHEIEGITEAKNVNVNFINEAKNSGIGNPVHQLM